MNEENSNDNYGFIFNPLAKLFKSLIPSEQKKIEDDLLKNTVTTSEEDLQSILKFGQNANKAGGYVSNLVSFEQVFRGKADKIAKFREMEDYPEINDALDIASDESIVKDVDGDIAVLNIEDEEDFPPNIVERIKEESDYILKKVFKIQKRGWQLYRRFLVEGEIFLEKIPNKQKDSIIGLKVMPAFKSLPVYESNIVKGFVHETLDPDKQYTAADIKLFPNQVAYVCWDGYINGEITNPKSYLWSCMKTYNQLKNLEDALIVYRLSRALEKRVFNVEIGQMPPGKAREFINKLINQYKRNTGYDPNTGMINSQQNLMSFNEDFWFDQRDGKGSTVTTLQSGMNLGKLEDIDYFKKKLYMALKMPKSRWEESTSLFGDGKNGEISREEIKFDMFIERVQNRFSDLFVDVLITQLKMKGVDDEWLDPGKFNYKFTKANFFAEFKENSLIENRLSILNQASPLMYSPMNTNGILSPEFVMKKYFKMSDDEYQENLKLLEKFKKENPPMDPFGGQGPNQENAFSPDDSNGDASSNPGQFDKGFEKEEKFKKSNLKKKNIKKDSEQIKERLEDGELL